MITYKTFQRLIKLNSIDEILHYFKLDNEKSLKFYLSFYSNELDYKTENKIIRAIIKRNQALLENTIKDIQTQARKQLINNL